MAPEISAPTPRSVRVAGAGAGIAQRITARGHALVSDEPPSVAGGADRGPDPYELLLAALGACTAITVRLYAARKGWVLEDVEVTLSHRRVHASDCEDCPRATRFLDEIEVELSLRGALEPAQRERLLEIAGRCPVNRTLRSEVRIRERLAERS
jgi:putative redox protein